MPRGDGTGYMHHSLVCPLHLSQEGLRDTPHVGCNPLAGQIQPDSFILPTPALRLENPEFWVLLTHRVSFNTEVSGTKISTKVTSNMF